MGDDEFASARDATLDTHVGELAKASGGVEQGIQNCLGRGGFGSRNEAHLVVELKLRSLAPNDFHFPS